MPSVFSKKSVGSVGSGWTKQFFFLNHWTKERVEKWGLGVRSSEIEIRFNQSMLMEVVFMMIFEKNAHLVNFHQL